MAIKEIKAKTILRKHKRIDSWFISQYVMNLYQGCIHDCIYCDGRSESYRVPGNFGRDVTIKTNAIEILEKEIRPSPRKQPLKPCYIMVGGGVGDSYQPVEETYNLTRKALKLLNQYHYPVSLLTKSTLIKRDMDILKDINERKRVLINFSFSSTDDTISKIFEPGLPSPSERLETITTFKEKGFSCGMFLLPVIPFITDQPDIIKQTIQDASDAGIDYIVFGGMTLKPGRQRKYFYKILQEHYPHLRVEYETIYSNDRWGQASPAYYHSIHETFNQIMKHYHIPKRIPSSLFSDILEENDRVAVILDQMDYLLKMQGKKSPYGFASYQISQLQEPLSTMKYELQTIKGVGSVTEKIIKEILKTNTCTYYERLLYE